MGQTGGQSTIVPGKSTDSSKPRVHLTFLDGIRGLTALYVAVFHLHTAQNLSPRDFPLLYASTRVLRYGHFAVDMFIVLSGYCLMLPAARSADGRLPRGLRSFFYRRVRRIFPPFWAALAFTICMILAIRKLGAHVRADTTLGLSLGSVLTHALMIHNLFPAYSDTINLPMWTVALEWQIYFVFALLLLPIWRRLGTLLTLAIAVLLGELPHFVFPSSYNLDWTCPWYLGLFAMGMAASLVHFSPSGAPRWPRIQRLAWGPILLILLAIATIVELVGGDQRLMQYLWAKDILAGLCAAVTLVYFANIVTGSHRAPSAFGTTLAGILQSKWIVLLGMFSYSLYLIHMPLMWPAKFIIMRLHLAPIPEFLFRVTVAPLTMLPIAYAFHRLFERPFMSATAFPRFKLRPDRPAVVVIGATPSLEQS